VRKILGRRSAPDAGCKSKTNSSEPVPIGNRQKNSSTALKSRGGTVLAAIGRLHWQKLVVRDCRALRLAEEIFSALIEHVRLSTGTGKVVPMITIFAPEHSDQRPVRIWNRQLIGYAGYRRSDGTILGDPLNVPLTEVLRKLGWTRDPAGPFDLLPVLIETSEGLRWFDWPVLGS